VLYPSFCCIVSLSPGGIGESFGCEKGINSDCCLSASFPSTLDNFTFSQGSSFGGLVDYIPSCPIFFLDFF